MFRLLFVLNSALSTRLRDRGASDRGASMVEYGLLVGLIAIVAIVAVETLGDGIFNLFDSASDSVNAIPTDGSTET